METQKTGNSKQQTVWRWLATAYIALGLSLTSHPSFAASNAAKNQSSRIEPLTIKVGARVRYESVDIARESGNALTTKLRLKSTYKLNKFRAFSELDYVESLLTSNHSDGVVFTGEPVIADPRGFDINQLFLDYTFGKTTLTLGRQDITFEDQRLVGDLAFRQNSQSYDGVNLEHKFVSGWSANYSYINRVNRIFGRQADRSLSRSDVRFTQLQGLRPTGQLGVHKVDGHLLHIAGRAHDYVEVFAIGQSLHNEDHSPFSNRTLLVGADGNYKSGKIKWQSSLILGKQKRQETNVDDWLSFSRLEFGATKGAYQLSYRQESFGSAGGQSFITPLGTLHKFQGWADQFLSTPREGLKDRSLLFRWRQLPYIIDARYHEFSTVRGSNDLGREFNVDLIYRIKRDQEFKLRFADFEPRGTGNNLTPVTKLFLMYSYEL